MAIVIDILVGNRETLQGFRNAAEELRKLNKVATPIRENLRQAAGPASQFARSLERIDRVGDGVASKLKAINAELSKMRRHAGIAQAATTVVNPSSGGGGSRGSRASAPPILDPRRALAYHEDQMFNGPDGQKAYHTRMANRARKQINAQDPNRQAMTALMRTRFGNINGRLTAMPLGIDLMRGGGIQGLMQLGQSASVAAGPLAALGPIAIAAAGGLAAVAAARHVGMTVATNRAKYGGSIGQSVAATTWAGALGLDAGAIDRVDGAIKNGQAAGIAARMGINVNRGPYGDMNKSGTFLQVLSGISKMGEREAQQAAAFFDTPELALARDLSPQTRDRLNRTAQGPTQSQVRATMELNAEMAILNQEWERTIVKMTPMVRMAATGVNLIGSVLEPLSDILAYYSRNMTPFGWATHLQEWWGGDQSGKTRSEKDLVNAIDANTRAINQNTIRFDDERRVLGGGPRAQNANVRGLGPANQSDYSEIPWAIF